MPLSATRRSPLAARHPPRKKKIRTRAVGKLSLDEVMRRFNKFGMWSSVIRTTHDELLNYEQAP